MIVLLSPAKKLDFEIETNGLPYGQPPFLEKSEKLIKKLSKLSRKKIASLMSISASLAELNYNRYQQWTLPNTTDNAQQAIYSFRGDVYLGFDADTLPKESFDFAQEHIRILSGLYGILKPMDLIQPHRLEMGTRLPIARKKNLYEYWKKDVATYLNERLETSDIIINLASNEYFKVVDTKAVKNRIVTCSFKENKNGTYKAIMVFAKKARGMMARYIVDHKITDPELLKGFNVEGYSYMENLSSENELCFVRG